MRGVADRRDPRCDRRAVDVERPANPVDRVHQMPGRTSSRAAARRAHRFEKVRVITTLRSWQPVRCPTIIIALHVFCVGGIENEQHAPAVIFAAVSPRRMGQFRSDCSDWPEDDFRLRRDCLQNGIHIRGEILSGTATAFAPGPWWRSGKRQSRASCKSPRRRR